MKRRSEQVGGLVSGWFVWKMAHDFDSVAVSSLKGVK